MTKPQISGQVARDYAMKYPKTPSRALARMLRRDHPALFSNTDMACTRIRYYRARQGQAQRKHLKRAGTGVAYTPMPKPEPVPFGVFDLAKTYPKIKRWLILADLHVPFHDNAPIETAIKWAEQKENRCDGILFLGDLCDCYSLSSWVRDPRVRRFGDEIKATGQVLDHLRHKLKPKAVVWKAGNHEYRLERYLMRRAAELFGMEQFTFRSFLDLDKRNVHFVNAMWPIKYRALTLLHGHEWPGGMSSPVNPARTAYLKMHDCALVAHRHRSSEHTEPCMGSDRVVTCWSVGCLCNLHPEYSPMNLWNHGFADLTTGHRWRVGNHRIVKGNVV